MSKMQKKIWLIRICLIGSAVGFYLLIYSLNHVYSKRSPYPLVLSMHDRRSNHVQHRPISRRFNYFVQRPSSIRWCHELRFVEPKGPVTALASYPGSGNTWVRYLIQQMTGLFTGSIYIDYDLMKNGFPAENVKDGSVIAVKTHLLSHKSKINYDRVVLLVRDPHDSFMAEFNRQNGGHIGHATASNYRSDQWQKYVLSSATGWSKFYDSWFNSFSSGNRHVVFYSDLKKDLKNELRRLGKFLLQREISEETLECVLSRRDGKFKRSKKKISFPIFDSKMNSTIDVEKKKVHQLLRKDVL